MTRMELDSHQTTGFQSLEVRQISILEFQLPDASLQEVPGHTTKQPHSTTSTSSTPPSPTSTGTMIPFAKPCTPS